MQAVAIPHSSSITNVIQFSTFYRTNDDDCAFAPGTERLIKPGDKALASACAFSSWVYVIDDGLGLVLQFCLYTVRIYTSLYAFLNGC